MASTNRGLETVKAKTAIKDEDGGIIRHEEASLEYDFTSSLTEMVEKFGEEIVYQLAVQQARISLQAAMRRLILEGNSEESIRIQLEDWRPGAQVGKTADPFAATLAKFATLSPEEQAEYLEKLRVQAQAATGATAKRSAQ